MEYLTKDPVLHADMLGCVRRGSARVLAASGSGVLLYDRDSGTHMLSAEDGETARRMLSGLGASELFVAHQECCAAAAEEKFGLCHRMPVCNAAYLQKEPIQESASPALIRRLDEGFLPFVREHYQNVSEDGYLLGRLRAGVMFGAFVEGEPAGFIGMHEEGSMGLLEVLPRFRRRGIAVMLETFLANRLLKGGAVPYAQIKAGNEVSVALHRRLGFRMSDYSICWLMR
ncbi:GNAT family N-acetyltransferase [Caproicibacter sp. BJN0012]